MTIEEAHDRRSTAYYRAAHRQRMTLRYARSPTEVAAAADAYWAAIREADYAWVNDLAAAVHEEGDRRKCPVTM